MKTPTLYILAAFGNLLSLATGSHSRSGLGLEIDLLDGAPCSTSLTSTTSAPTSHIHTTTITVTSTVTTSIGCSESPTTISTTIPTTTSCTDTDPTSTTPTVPTTTELPTTTCGTATTTVTGTPTPSSLSCPVQPDCPPLGLNVDYYSNQFGYNGYTSPTAGQTEEEMFPPSYYVTKGLTPLDSSLTNITYIPQDYSGDLSGYPRLYLDARNPQVPYYVGYRREVNGGIVVDGNNYTLVYSGFYRAPTSGSYTICSSADKVDYSYLGGGVAFDCFSGHPDTNASPLNGASAGGNYINPVSCGSVNLVAGEFYPIRSVFGNGDAVSAFNLTIQAPGEGVENDNAGLLYPVNCRL